MVQSINRKWAIFIGCLLSFPTAYFIFINVLKYALGMPFLYDTAEPLMNRLGLKDGLGFNINLVILFGPLVALLINLPAVLQLEWHNEKEKFFLQFSVKKSWWNMCVIIFSGLLLAILFAYAIGENCRNCDTGIINFYDIILI
jgi:hypothetical protein